MKRVRLGILLGLYEYQKDFTQLIRHAWHLKKRFGDFPITFSFPRLRPADGIRLFRIRLIFLGKQAAKVIWMEGDITCAGLLPHAYDLWHDRAVFHFLTCPEDRRKYIDRLSQSLKPDGHVIVATFGLNGPPRCSGLDVVRYSPEGLLTELGQDFSLIESFEEDHKTPGGTLQQFICCHFIHESSNPK